MKKLIFILILTAAAAVSYGQAGYTRINSRYNWLGGLFDAFGIPAGGTATFQSGQAPRAGALYYDSTGVDSGLYVWSGLAWRLQTGLTSVPTLQEVLDEGNIATNTNIDFVNGSISFTGSGYGLIFHNGGGNNVYLLAGGANSMRYVTTGGVNYVDLDNSLITGTRNQKFPDASGTFALTSDIPATAGIDDVLAVGQTLTAARTVTQAGFRMTYSGGDLWADNFTGTSLTTSGTGINSNGVFDIRRTITAAGNHRGFFDGTYFNNSTVSNHSYAAFDVKDTMFVGSGSTSDHQISFQSRPLKLGDGTLTHLYNFGAATPKISAGTVTNMYGLYYFSPQITGTGVLTNNWGVYIPTLTGATNNYGAYFADNVGIGTSTPATKLHVAGTLRFVTGNQGANELLASDASGNADWVPGTGAAVGLGNVDNTSDATKNAATVTLTNKRITRRVTTITSSATPTPDSDASDIFTVSALAAGAVFAAPTGTPTEGQGLIIRIVDNGGAQTLGFNAVYRAGDIALPTTTVAGKYMYLGFLYNDVSDTWDLVSKIDNL